MKISAALKKLIENPDDLSTLPQLVAQVEELEGSETEYQTRIDQLQQINKRYLAQIPIAGHEDDKPETDPEPTLEDAKAHIIQAMTGGN